MSFINKTHGLANSVVNSNQMSLVHKCNYPSVYLPAHELEWTSKCFIEQLSSGSSHGFLIGLYAEGLTLMSFY